MSCLVNPAMWCVAYRVALALLGHSFYQLRSRADAGHDNVVYLHIL
jgi:hypothetical protein